MEPIIEFARGRRFSFNISMRIRKTIFVSMLVLAVAVTSFGGTLVIQAQDSTKEGLMIRPSLFELRAQPGETVTEVINVTNRAENALVLYPAVRDIDSMDERGKPIWTDPTLEKTGAELSSWTTFSQSALHLQPGETAEVTVSVRVPTNAPNGGAFGLASFVKNPPGVGELGGDSGLGIGFTTGSLMAITIGDEISDEANLLSFNANPGIGSGPGVTFESRLENLGNALIRPVGVIEVSNMFGKFTSSVSFNEAGGAMLPSTIRDYETKWEGQGFLIGRYTADVFISYGAVSKKTLVGTTSFWILPAKTLLTGLGVVFIGFLIIFGWIRSYIRRRLRDAGQSASSGTRPSSFVAILVSALVIASLALAFAFLFLA